MCDHKSEIKQIVSVIDIDSMYQNKIIDKSLELIRLLNLKFSGNMKNLNNNIMPISIELSCKIFSVSFDKTKLSNYKKYISISDYNRLLNTCKNVLNIKTTSTSILDVLSVRLDANLTSKSLEILDKYQKDYVDKLEPNRRKGIEINSTLYQSVAYYIASKDNEIKIDKRKIVEIAEIDYALFNNLLNDITNTLHMSSRKKNKENEQLCNEKLMNKVIPPNIKIVSNPNIKISNNFKSNSSSAYEKQILKAFNVNAPILSSNIISKNRNNKILSETDVKMKNICTLINNHNRNIYIEANSVEEDDNDDDNEYEKWKESLLKKRKISIDSTDNIS